MKWSDPFAVGRILVGLALEEDRALEDAASGSLGEAGEFPGTCRVVAREELVVAGWFLLEEVYSKLAVSMGTEPVITGQMNPDGDVAMAGEIIGEIRGPSHVLLRGERTALNFLCRLSGIATTTRRYVDAVRETNVEVLDTRKTTPCHRALEKYAVRMGGGVNHRMDLAVMAMFKDNHLAVLGGTGKLKETVRRLRSRGIPVEVEIDDLDQLAAVLDSRPDRILLDNMAPGLLTQAVRMASGSNVYLEASGGVTLENIAEYAATGVDGVSCGALIHSASSADIGFDWSV